MKTRFFKYLIGNFVFALYLLVEAASGQTPVKPSVNVSPSANYNYIHTIVPQVGVTSIPAGARSPSQYMETIEYFDGLGRPMQTVSVGASPDGKDIVIPVEYDAFGREAVKYLPYLAATNDGTYKANALAAADISGSQRNWYSAVHIGIPADTRPFSEITFEASPLNRPTEQYGPGQAWKSGGKRQQTDYKTNTSADNVRLWVASASQVATTKPYDAGTLYITESTDEDGRRTLTYTDLQERVVRQRQVNGSEYADTDYCYDDFGRLAYVLPPAVPKAGGLTIAMTDSDPWFSKYVYAYRYDHRGRVIEKHIPGAGWTHIVYNKLDQPVLTQDAAQRPRSEWSFTKYDAHGRVVITGLYTNASQKTREEVQGLADGTTRTQWESRAENADYSNTAFPETNTSIHTVNYYDNYMFPGNPFTGTSDRTHGLPTGSKTRVLDSSPELWLFSVSYYNSKGRVVETKSEQLTQDGASKATDRTKIEYDFVGRAIKTERSIANQ